MRIAAIDVGSNSVHMVVAQVDPDGHFRVLDRAKEMVGLGRHALTSKRLSSRAMDDAIQALAQFKTLASRHGVHRYRAVATSAVREAVNGGDFVQRVKDEVGFRLRVVPGREEARLIFLGAAQAVDLRGEPALILDIGGGSVELILVANGRPAALHSVKIGVARLSETFLDRDPPTERSLRAMEAHVRETLDPLLAPLRERAVSRVVGTSGTMQALVAAAAFRLGVLTGPNLHGLEIPASAVTTLSRKLRGAGREERLRVRGIDAKRVDLIVPGAVVAEHVLRRLKARTVVACTWALREGIIQDYVLRHTRGLEESARFADVRRRSVARVLRRLGYEGAHHTHVARLATRMWDQLQHALRLPAASRDWLEYAALLHDVGHAIGHERHPEHSYYLIVHGELFGFSREEIEIIGQVARHHDRKGVSKVPPDVSSPLAAPEWRVVRGLAAILRIAEGLDRTHFGVIRDVRVRESRGTVTLRVATAGDDVQLELWEARRRVDLLARLLGAEVRIAIARHSTGA